jgi:ubiquinone/menaquinone biosynthesis C-methylase UbiE
MTEKDNLIYQEKEMARLYSKCRPTYPDELFRYLTNLAPKNLVAVDCGTGTGQAAHSLGKHFSLVVAIDPSQEQLTEAIATTKMKNVNYLRGKAEIIPLPDQSVDLVAAAQAVHWFSLERFYSEVERVLRPGGVLAIWCYLLPSVSEALDAAVKKLFRDIRLYKHWPGWIKDVERGYETLRCFPEKKWSPFRFKVTAKRNLDGFLGFIDTWVATRLARQNADPAATACIEEGWKEIAEAWGQAATVKSICWEISGATVRPTLQENNTGRESN